MAITLMAVLRKGLLQRTVQQKGVNRLRPMVCKNTNYF